MVDANTIIGDPIPATGGTVIIPVSKVSVGIASGGVDYNGKDASPRQNFGGGGGTGLTVVEKTPDIIAKLKDIFKKEED